MKTTRLQQGPVTLYAQVASILRDRIVTGAWANDEKIPTIDELQQQLSVARITIRQAIQMLSSEGLLSSHRGRRTHVTYEALAGDRSPLFRSVGSIESENLDYSVAVLSRERVTMLPPGQAQIGAPAKLYVRIRKVDSEAGVPYVVSDNYVASSIARRFPRDAERRIKVSRLVRDYALQPLEQATEITTVGQAGYDEATHLNCPLSATVVRVTRIFLGAGEEIAYLGTLVYRGDRFRIERDISKMVKR